MTEKGEHTEPGEDGAAHAAETPGVVARRLPQRPGVYRMLDGDGTVLYVGKAKNLRRRVSSYFTGRPASARTAALLERVADLETTVTHTEAEALILESRLIKEYRPRYNVLLRDDKSYPFIHLSTHQRFPRLSFHRGRRAREGKTYGPFPSASAVRETLTQLQKVIPVRQCRDSFYRNRTRPCLQHQIHRCTAPCVGLISEEAYREDVHHAELFLEGRSQEVIERFVQRMEAAAAQLEFEDAARWRDRIAALRRIQEQQHVAGEGGDLDVVACAREGDAACIQVYSVRGGQSLGSHAFFPEVPAETDDTEVLAAFIAHYYMDRETPGEIVVSHALEDAGLLSEALTRDAGHPVAVRHRVRSERRRWVEAALDNARYALASRSAEGASMERRYRDLARFLDVDEPPQRMECFDVSHTAGEATVASCVVFNRDGPLKSDYRRFNIRDVTPGDDYAAMEQAIHRRYRRIRDGELPMPDLLLIDGGQGQLSSARRALDAIGIDGLAVVGIAKGPERRPGEETLLFGDGEQEVTLPADSAALHLLQHIRDEAHRFAITGHRQQRQKARRESALEEIPGLGPKRRQSLLKSFGGLRAIRRAGVDDLATAPGISRELAQRIYDTFHG